uniref:IS1595 family transposase n=1 Tax=Faecalibaculum rodentium TaxID=1702221 RepID=UPI00258A551E
MFRKLLFKDLTFTDIHTLYSDPREAERFFFDLKWKDGFVCSKCGHTHCTTVIRKNGSLRTVYQCSHCGHQESATVGTALEDTKAPLFSWILVMFVFVMSKTGTSAKYISNLTGVSYHTTKFMLRKIRQAQKQDNETHAATDCDAIGLDVFSYCGKKHENGGKKHGKRGWGAEGKGNVAAAVIRQYVWEDT